MKRNPQAYKTKEEPRGTGKPRTLVSVSSLSAQARKLYRAERRTQTPQGDDLVIEQLEGAQAPWYVTADLNWYIEHYRDQYERALEMAELVEALGRYDGDDRTAYTEDFAREHGISLRTLYRMQQNYLQASAWALKYERLIGGNYDYFKVLSLSRKPKDSNTLPLAGTGSQGAYREYLVRPQIPGESRLDRDALLQAGRDRQTGQP